jgi:hypothetical protein
MRRLIVRQEVSDELDYVVGEVIGGEIRATAQRSRRDVTSSRGTTHPQVDAARVQGL